MKCMWKTLAISITVLSLSSCSLFGRKETKSALMTDFERGKYLVSISEYEQAEPYLIKTVTREDNNYAESVLMLGKIYDQMALPERAILNLRDFLQRGKGSEIEVMQAKALLLKNLAKVKYPIDNADEKKFISRIMTAKGQDLRPALEALRWTLDFNCGIYCVEEVTYLKEIQMQLLYAVESDPSLYKRVFDVLTSRYDYFETFLKEPQMDLEYRKKIAQGLYEALQKLKSSHLESSTLGSVKTAELISYLEAYQKRIERWLYE